MAQARARRRRLLGLHALHGALSGLGCHDPIVPEAVRHEVAKRRRRPARHRVAAASVSAARASARSARALPSDGRGEGPPPAPGGPAKGGVLVPWFFLHLLLAAELQPDVVRFPAPPEPRGGQ
eukprot:1228586-Prymnesium_polylepis.1